MYKIKVVLIHGKFVLERDFQVSYEPQVGRIISIQIKRSPGILGVKVKQIEQPLERDFLVLCCDADLKKMCYFFADESGWKEAEGSKSFAESGGTARILEDVWHQPWYPRIVSA